MRFCPPLPRLPLGFIFLTRVIRLVGVVPFEFLYSYFQILSILLNINIINVYRKYADFLLNLLTI